MKLCLQRQIKDQHQILQVDFTNKKYVFFSYLVLIINLYSYIADLYQDFFTHWTNSRTASLTSSWLISSGLLWITETPLTSLSSSPTWTKPVRRQHEDTEQTASITVTKTLPHVYRSYLNISIVVRSTDTGRLRPQLLSIQLQPQQ